MEWRVREVGRSKCFRESWKIEHETWLIAENVNIRSVEKACRRPTGVSLRENLETFKDEKAKDGH